ncbi:MAG: hypothetical protein HN509_01465 [Halobacteriovoraceae bacterium]|nr:hypothetical protein [Halobacteriovoraceae bacterium]MBT5095832.1 hypothetical protein [Halobacteriovoraceae bacterium]
MKWILVAATGILLALSSQVQAFEGDYNKGIYQSDRCIELLTQGRSSDSYSYSLDSDDYQVRDYGNDHLADAYVWIRILIGKLGCGKKDINFGKGPLGRAHSRCRRLVPHAANSITCYIESNLGYFFVTHDMQTKVNIVFNRFD